jgi:orotidine-5'-phosphate decarboxylase
VVARSARQAALLQVEMFTLHLSGGSAMVRAVADALSDIPLLRPKIMGITVLTSFDDVRWAEVTKSISRHASDTLTSALNLVEHAVPWGADGIVCSAAELSEIRRLHPSLSIVVPGIRPEGWSSHDQARVATPGLARELGANAIVMGRPLIEVSHPRRMVESILRDLGPAAASA